MLRASFKATLEYEELFSKIIEFSRTTVTHNIIKSRRK